MSLDRWNRLFGHLTLGLSCVALVFAETPFLPGLQLCLPPVLALLLLAWWVEGRWILPAWGANILGALIAAGAVVFLTTQLSDSDSWVSQVPMRLALIPYMGPLVIAALLVKLFRPRRPGDFHRLQALGLLQVSLGCVLAEDPGFGFLLAAYLASALACLALHYRQACASAQASEIRAKSAGWLFLFALRWSLLVGPLALLLFFLTPRRDGSTWEPLRRVRTENEVPTLGTVGLSDEINLNRIGKIEADNEIALRVSVADAEGQPKLDLRADRRWRGPVLDWYEGGKWTTTHHMAPLPRLRRRQRELPDFGAGQYYMTFTIRPHQTGGPVLAEPIHFGPPSARLPVVPISGGRSVVFGELAGTVLPLLFSAKQEYQYRQVLPAGADPNRTVAEGIHEGPYLGRLTRQFVPGLEKWTIDLLRRLSTQPRYRLPDSVRAALGRRSFLLDPPDWEPTARVLTEYLSSSSEFTYTLEMTRSDLTVDPAMDFLVNLKRGHCERYATALALMLRSLGIPSRVVKGFRGADHEGDGVYVVRHNNAHAWVEMLAPRGDARPIAFDWLTLDPTPAESTSDPTAFSLSQWWHERQRNTLEIWRTLIVDYNADEQADLWDNLKAGRRLPTLLKIGLLILTGLLGLLACFLLRRRLRCRRAAGARAADAVAFHARLLALLARYAALRPRFGQTPREFGEAARQFLQARPKLASLAELPNRAVELFYRVRFGERPLTEPERAAIQTELERLAEALR